MNTVKNDEKERIRLLLTLYEIVEGNLLQGANDTELSEQLGLDEDTFHRHALYLKEEGFIRFLTFTSISLEHRGRKLVESIMEESYSQKKRRVLETIAEMSRASDFISYPELAQRLQMADQELARYCNGLDEEGLIDFPGGDIIQIRDAGWEALEVKKETASTLPANIMYINQNYGAAAQGTNFTQNVTQVKHEVNDSIEKLLKAADDSTELSAIQKITLKSDINMVHQLAQMEKTPEIVETASTKIDAINQVLSSTADMVSLGMVVIPIIRAFFNI